MSEAVRFGFFGGVYNNHLALEQTIDTFQSLGVEETYCLGDIGGFGPHPDRSVELLRDRDVKVIQGNYDEAIGHEREDCQCGYTDPEDNYFAKISYDYTLANTSDHHRDWMRTLEPNRRVEVGPTSLHLCHGSPRKMNEFVWESTASDAFLNRLLEDSGADVILGTHTGMHWHRPLPEGGHFVNVGVIGRPANDGNTHVWACLLELEEEKLSVEFLPIPYDHRELARQMEEEDLPDEFIETILTGWWTTCLEVLPAKERSIGPY